MCTAYKKGSNKNELCGELFVDHPAGGMNSFLTSNAGGSPTAGKIFPTELFFSFYSFLWTDEAPIEAALFPPNRFGQYVLHRQRVLDTEIARYVTNAPGGTPSVYLLGCRGCGKTSMLTLLARSFQSDGYRVYYFHCASAIPQGISCVFKSLLKDRTQKVAVLIDEVESNPNAELFTALLKSGYTNLVTIGASVHRYVSLGMTANFAIKVPMSELCLQRRTTTSNS